MKKINIDLHLLKAVLAESDLIEVSTYIDTETGEIVSEKDMFLEEVQNREQFLKVPSSRIWSINKEVTKKWVENILEVVAENYDSNFLLKAKTKLEQAAGKNNSLELVCAALSELQGEGLDDNYFSDWLNFVKREEVNNIKTWLASERITLDCQQQ